MMYSTYTWQRIFHSICILYRCFLLVVLPLSSLVAGQVIPDKRDSLQNKEKEFSVFLIGDAGAQSLNPNDPALTLLGSQLSQVGEKGTVIFLGNNLLSKSHDLEDALTNNGTISLMPPQLEVIKHFTGKRIFIPGNYEWAGGKKNGWERLQNEEKLIEDLIDKGNVFLPDGGCPGPVEVNLSEWLTLVILDTQWWLHPFDKPETESDCEAKDASGIVIQLEDILHRNGHKQVLVVGHHPIYSYGKHGGYSPAKLHLFPLTALHKSLYVPLPVIGSLYPVYRKVLGNLQDIPHPRYLIQRNELVDIFKKHSRLIYASGHEQSLQHISKDGVDYITSGSFSATDYLSKKKRDDLLFGASKKGFARLDYLKEGEVWLSFWATNANGDAGELIYQKKLIGALLQQTVNASEGTMPLTDTLITVPASTRYNAGALKRKMLGETYRTLWQEPITFPVFDITKEKGGLTILKRGGGLQTKSLRLQARDGKQYVLRSIDKTTSAAIPGALQETFAADVVQDQISASHPYGALIIPPLAQKAGVYSTRPKVVYVGDDARLGKYQTLFANTLNILEERPEEEQNSNPEQEEKVYSTTKLLSKLQDSNDNRVNEHEVLRARLFDMLIGDWDRHDDQWRWLAKKTGSGIAYYPLPRDRDQVFFLNQGLLPKIASRKWIMPKFQGFDYNIRDVAGFNFNARYFDRSFLNELSLPDWLAMADTFQTLLTDAAIEQAISEWPKKVQDLSGKEVIAKLKSRRDHLKKYAQTYYQFLSREVDIVGSKKEEYFYVQRLNGGHIEVKVYNLQHGTAEKEPFYERVFDQKETKEIRLYGLGGEDRFKIEGSVKQSMKVRIIGGTGEDQVYDSSFVNGLSKKTWVYDTRKGNKLSLNSESKNLTSQHRRVNEYNRRAFQYNYLSPLASIQFNPDDGLFIGAGVLYKTHGFRKEPFATQHRLTGNFAFATHAYNIDYRGEFTHVISGLDLETNAEVNGPNYVNNFFGFGNESVYNENEQGISFYRARVRSIKLNTLLIKNIFRTQKLFIGPAYETYQVENTKGRFISQTSENGLEGDNVFRQKHYAGLKLGFLFDTRDNEMLPTSGTYWHTESGLFKGVNSYSGDYAKIESALCFFWSFRLPARVTLATRFGGGINFGDYEFFQANTLGGLTNLRGYRGNRFTGKSSLYNNTELRVRVFSFKTYLFPAHVGILGFHDVGRVWVKEEDSTTWHNSAGGGIWLAPFNRAVISLMYGISKEDRLPLLRVGFLF